MHATLEMLERIINSVYIFQGAENFHKTCINSIANLDISIIVNIFIEPRHSRPSNNLSENLFSRRSPLGVQLFSLL